MKRSMRIERRYRIVRTALAGALLALALAGCSVSAQEPVYLPLVAQNQAPTDTPIPPTDTPLPPTDTPVPPTDTPLPPTDTPTATRTPGGGSSVRFFGNGRDAIDRIVIPIDAPERPADVGATDFTIEFWIKAEPGANRGNVSCGANDGWITGNIVFDRDVYFQGDYGDFGIALHNGAVAFGLSVGFEGATLCGSRTVADNQWHHVAVTRRTNGDMAIFVDGQPDGATRGAAGDASYRNGRATTWNWDPYIVLGAEKHDAGAEYPSFSGWLDELRISNTVRYEGAFTPPSTPFAPDANTMALYHFDEGAGVIANDSANAPGGPSHGQLRVGGNPSGPVWSEESPF